MSKVAGAIIKNKEGKILLIDRKKFPFGWAGPAGHIDKDESPEETLTREVKEEVNLNIKKNKLLLHEFVEWNVCCKGTRGHDWYLYEILDYNGEVKINKEEAKSAGWYSAEEIKELKLEEVWEYWFKKLNII